MNFFKWERDKELERQTKLFIEERKKLSEAEKNLAKKMNS